MFILHPLFRIIGTIFIFYLIRTIQKLPWDIIIDKFNGMLLLELNSEHTPIEVWLEPGGT